MELFALYLQFLSEICEGTRPAPAGITVPASGAEEKVQAVQQAALEMGIDAFVRACAEAEGREVPQEWYDNFDLAQVIQAMGQFGQAKRRNRRPRRRPPRQMRQTTRRTRRRRSRSPTARATPARSCLTAAYWRMICSRIWWSCSRQRMKWGFFRLSQVTARKQISLEDFLIWLGNKELDASEEEQACVAILDACLQRWPTRVTRSCWRRCFRATRRRLSSSAARRRS